MTGVEGIQKITYNSDGKKSNVAYYYKNELQWQADFKYDNKGNLIKEPNVSYEYIMSYIHYKYNKANNLISAKERDRSFFWPLKIKYKFDENDSIIEIKPNRPKSKFIYKFNEKGLMTERTDYYHRFLKGYCLYSITKFEYDENKNKIAHKSYFDSVIYRINYIYDDKNNPIVKSEFNKLDPTGDRVIKFSYDENNNWIKRTEYGGYYIKRPDVRHIGLITFREIEYY